MQPAERKREWQNRRVFFLTPQVLLNDLSREACPALFVKCLVVDEAHKALGNHAYCQVFYMWNLLFSSAPVALWVLACGGMLLIIRI